MLAAACSKSLTGNPYHLKDTRCPHTHLLVVQSTRNQEAYSSCMTAENLCQPLCYIKNRNMVSLVLNKTGKVLLSCRSSALYLYPVRVVVQQEDS